MSYHTLHLQCPLMMLHLLCIASFLLIILHRHYIYIVVQAQIIKPSSTLLVDKILVKFSHVVIVALYHNETWVC